MFVTFFVNLLAKIALFFYAIVARIRQSSSLFYLQVLTGIACAGLLLVVLQNTIMWRLNYVTLQIPEMLQSLDVYDQFSEVEKAQMPNQNGEILSKNINKIWTVVNGDNFINILARLNIGTSEIQKILKQINKEKQIARLSLGQQISVTADCTIKYHQENANTSTSGSYLPLKMRPSAACSLVKLQMQTKDDRRIVITKNANEFTTHITAISTSSKNKVIKGAISSSLYGDASKAGVPAALMAQVLTQYSFDIDFQRDIHQNDEFAFVFEEIVDENGNKIRNGKLLFSELILSGKSYKLYNFHNDFYNAKGESAKKALLKTPIDGARISSGFGRRKAHAVGYSTMHRGVDFAAPIGTPIYAAGDGRVDFAGKQGGYGNCVTIRHNKTMQTHYAHMKNVRKGIYNGARVSQREVIGYVGMTGITSGPHLHFEIRINGEKVNPSQQRFAAGKSITKQEKSEFDKIVASINSLIER